MRNMFKWKIMTYTEIDHMIDYIMTALKIVSMLAVSVFITFIMCFIRTIIKDLNRYYRKQRNDNN